LETPTLNPNITAAPSQVKETKFCLNKSSVKPRLFGALRNVSEVGGAESTWVSVNSGVFHTASSGDPDVSVLCCFADWGENQEKYVHLGKLAEEDERHRHSDPEPSIGTAVERNSQSIKDVHLGKLAEEDERHRHSDPEPSIGTAVERNSQNMIAHKVVTVGVVVVGGLAMLVWWWWRRRQEEEEGAPPAPPEEPPQAPPGLGRAGPSGDLNDPVDNNIQGKLRHLDLYYVNDGAIREKTTLLVIKVQNIGTGFLQAVSNHKLLNHFHVRLQFRDSETYSYSSRRTIVSLFCDSLSIHLKARLALFHADGVEICGSCNDVNAADGVEICGSCNDVNAADGVEICGSCNDDIGTGGDCLVDGPGIINTSDVSRFSFSVTWQSSSRPSSLGDNRNR
ncbi:hypothetical protein C0J52_22042, partial [Blattella germanica]